MQNKNCQRLLNNFSALKDFIASYEVDKNNLQKTREQKQKVEIGISACRNDLESIYLEVMQQQSFIVDGVFVERVGNIFVESPDDNFFLNIQTTSTANKKLRKSNIREAFENKYFDSLFPGAKSLNNILKIFLEKYSDDSPPKITDYGITSKGELHVSLKFKTRIE